MVLNSPPVVEGEEALGVFLSVPFCVILNLSVVSKWGGKQDQFLPLCAHLVVILNLAALIPMLRILFFSDIYYILSFGFGELLCVLNKSGSRVR
jgi:hypothetical protein